MGGVRGVVVTPDQAAVTYTPPPRTGFLTLPVLQWAWGWPLDDLTWNLVDSLRPSSVRVSTGFIATDARPWRVTIYVRGDRVERIEQEVVVGLRGGLPHGHALSEAWRARGVK